VPKIGYFGPDNNFFSFIEKLSQYVNYTTVQNITGTPSIALPMAKDAHNLPIGIQFSAAMGQDRQLIELAFEIEQHNGFVSC
jgi:amidase